MPVTAKLSRKFYERLGDDIANELVDWFNAVDDTYRMQLRELNELNWNRFQAAMDARFAEFEVKLIGVSPRWTPRWTSVLPPWVPGSQSSI